jgi:hypothetical protein
LNSGFASKRFVGAALLTALLALSSPCRAGDLTLPVTGDVLGTVVDDAGVPQMGATVQLFNRYKRVIAKTMTGVDGRFAFLSLPVDLYSIRVSLASFLPATRDQIAVRAGMESMLEIHLATLFSNVRVHYTTPTAAMMEDWKWVLRSSPATRLITRYLPPDSPDNSVATELHSSVFSDTHAMISVSGGNEGWIDTNSMQSDMGTGFILSTNILGKNQVQVGGTYGQNSNLGPPAMGLCAIYSRGGENGFGEPPEIALTVSQFALLNGTPQPGPNAGPAAAVRVMSLSTYQVFDPAAGIHIEYGATGESIDFASQHTSRVSPYGRVTVDLGLAGQFAVAYSDGDRPQQLLVHQAEASTGPDMRDQEGDNLAEVAEALAQLPKLSNRNGNLELERTQNYELGYSKTLGSRTYAVSAFRENVANGWVNMAGNLTGIQPNDLLSDGISQTSAYNIGKYARDGYLASLNQKISDTLDVVVAYGRMGGFMPDSGSLLASLNGETGILDERDQNLLVINAKGKLARTGTQIWTSYGWSDQNAIVPQHFFMTQTAYAAPGLDVFVRQPLPALFGMPGRVELTADLRNLLAQGYLPLGSSNGRGIFVMQSPRVLRGGLNFVF